MDDAEAVRGNDSVRLWDKLCIELTVVGTVALSVIDVVSETVADCEPEDAREEERSNEKEEVALRNESVRLPVEDSEKACEDVSDCESVRKDRERRQFRRTPRSTGRYALFRRW